MFSVVLPWYLPILNCQDQSFLSEVVDSMKKHWSKKSASIGANATIVCGVTIGEYALIGSGAVVTKDVPDYALVIGNPGRVVGIVDKKGYINSSKCK
jgi:serine acetyltransferase